MTLPILVREQADLRPCVHPAYVRMLCAALRAEGKDVDALLSAAGISGPVLARAEEMLPLRIVRSIIVGAQRAAGRPTFALETGAQVQMASHGAIGYALSTSANLRQTLDVLVRFMPCRSGAVQLVQQVTADGTWLVFEPSISLGDVRAFVLDHVAASFSSVMAAVSGQRQREAVLEVPWAAPAWRRAYDALAGKVRFGTGRMAYWLPNALLDAPCPTAAPAAFASAWRECEQQERIEIARYTAVARVENLLQLLGADAWSLAEVAASLGVSPRTLNRRLKDEGTSFQALLDRVRRCQALWHVRHTDATLEQIARELGYHDGNNLSRAFRRWFGAVPAAMREGRAPWPTDLSSVAEIHRQSTPPRRLRA